MSVPVSENEVMFDSPRFNAEATDGNERKVEEKSAAQKRIEELGRIILAYSEVTERLQKSHEQLTATVVRLQSELGEKNKQLERKNRLAALGEMAAGMAHEIRNPLGAIQLYTSMLAGDVKAMPETLKIVEKVRGGILRLEDIVTKVLHFSRDLRVNREEGDVAQLVAEAVEFASAKAAKRGVILSLHGPGSLVGTFDRVMMGQAVLNILQNGVEATPAGGEVKISWWADGGRCVVRIADGGKGIEPAVMEKIFNPFFTTKDEGTGLGLAIVHRVVEAHDGAITVRNEVNGGAVFEVKW